MLLKVQVKGAGLRDRKLQGTLAFALILAISLLNNGCIGVTGSDFTISKPSATSVSPNAAQVSWTSSAPATSQVEFGTSSSYGQVTPLDPNLVINHAQGLSGLAPGTLYHCRVRSRNANNVEVVSPDATFTTMAAPDTTPPMISAVQAAPAATSVTVSWTTDEPSDSQVEFGTTTNYGQSSLLTLTAVTSHSVAISGLNASTLYHYRVKSRDAAGNLATSSDFTFTTAALADTTPPSVSITAPAAGATVSDTIGVSASASDNVGVVGVQFKVDGVNTGAEDTVAPYSYSLDTRTLSNGSHSLTAVARDAAGNTATSAAVTVNISNAVASATPGGLVAAYSFNEGSGSVVTDFSGNSNTGTINGATWAAGKYGSGLSFSGVSNSYIRMLNSPSVNISGTQITVSMWANMIDSGGGVDYVLLSKPGFSSSAAGPWHQYAIEFDQNGRKTFDFYFSDAGGTLYGPFSMPATLGAWVHVAFTYDGATVKGYVNGAQQLLASVSASIGARSTDLLIGVDGNLKQGYNGMLDEVRIYNRALSQTEIQTDISTPLSGTPLPAVVDTTPPSIPAGLTALAASSSQISLSWTASTDNVGVAGYRIYRNGSQMATTSSTSYLDGGLAASTSYSYTVAAYDTAGNVSGQSAAASATTSSAASGSGIPSTLGWYQIPNTKLAPVCPDPALFPGIGGATGCGSVIAAWSGGIADTKRNRLIVWGGGHNDYYGNEVYALDLNTLTMNRLNNPSPPNTTGTCVMQLSDGKPNIRHTYTGLAYVQSIDAMYAYGGSLACPSGDGGTDTWLLDLATLQWQRKGGAKSPSMGVVADYGPISQRIYMYEGNLWEYNPAMDSYTQFNSGWAGMSYLITGIIDPKRNLFLFFGNGMIRAFDLAAGHSHEMQTWDTLTTGCSAMQNGFYMGLAYDPVQDRIVAWLGGDSVYLFNPDTKSCASVTYPNGPGAAQPNGTFGRFRYFPSLGVFAVVNGWQQNAYALRLTPTGSTTTSAAPVISNVAASGITTTGATITWTTDQSATTQAEYGTTTSYGALTPLNSNLVTSHSQSLSGLALGTLYHYRVRSKNSSGAEAISGDFAFATNNTTDTTAPTVSLATPANGATVSGSVSVSASASDNVGVVGVQFLLDGANLGAEVTSAPYSVSWETTTATNGTHTLAARARDAAGNTATSIAITVTVSNTASTSLQDFQARCQAAGVIRCTSFDPDADFTSTNLHPGDDGKIHGFKDCSISTSGCALRFDFPGLSGSNGAGQWEAPLGLLNQPFGANSTFYAQYRMRLNATMAQTNWDMLVGSSPKFSIFHRDSLTCASVELTTNRYGWNGANGFPMMYTDCGGRGLFTNNGVVPYQLEQGDYNCWYTNFNPTDCFYLSQHADTWMTFYWEIHIGNWGQANSSVRAWVGLPGQPLKRFVDMPAFILYDDGPSANYYNHITLTFYMTAKNASVDHPLAQGWFDELIVSTQPIAAPKN